MSSVCENRSECDLFQAVLVESAMRAVRQLFIWTVNRLWVKKKVFASKGLFTYDVSQNRGWQTPPPP